MLRLKNTFSEEDLVIILKQIILSPEEEATLNVTSNDFTEFNNKVTSAIESFKPKQV